MPTPLHEPVSLRRSAPQAPATAPPHSVPEAVPTGRQAAKRLPVIILSGGVTGLGVLRTFARQGIPAYVYATPLADPIRHSRWYRALPGTDDRSSVTAPSVALLEKVLADSQLPGAFLCACSDDWNRVVAAFAERPAGTFISMAPSGLALEILQNKRNLARLLQALGVPMPNTLPVDTSVDVAELPPSNGTFYFFKPSDSQSFLARFGKKGIRVSTADEARNWLDVISAADMSVVLQEYIPGSAAEHFFIDGYADRSGVIKGLFARRRQRIYPPDFGNSSALVSVPLSEVAGAVDSVRRVLEAADYRGIFSVELKRDPRDGVFKLLEINARPWWFVDFAVRCGVDVCRMAYDDAQGSEVQAVDTYSIGTTCIFPYYDFFSMQRLVAAGQTSWRGWALDVLRALQPVACLDDPMPAIVATARILRKALRNRLAGSAA
jgi:predicted ATP-grasp superfamily ATP-dependent carboligase